MICREFVCAFSSWTFASLVVGDFDLQQSGPFARSAQAVDAPILHLYVAFSRQTYPKPLIDSST